MNGDRICDGERSGHASFAPAGTSKPRSKLGRRHRRRPARSPRVGTMRVRNKRRRPSSSTCPFSTNSESSAATLVRDIFIFDQAPGRVESKHLTLAGTAPPEIELVSCCRYARWTPASLCAAGRLSLRAKCGPELAPIGPVGSIRACLRPTRAASPQHRPCRGLCHAMMVDAGGPVRGKDRALDRRRPAPARKQCGTLRHPVRRRRIGRAGQTVGGDHPGIGARPENPPEHPNPEGSRAS